MKFFNYKDIKIKYKLILIYGLMMVMILTSSFLTINYFLKKNISNIINNNLRNNTHNVTNTLSYFIDTYIKNQLKIISQKNLTLISHYYELYWENLISEKEAKDNIFNYFYYENDTLSKVTIGDVSNHKYIIKSNSISTDKFDPLQSKKELYSIHIDYNTECKDTDYSYISKFEPWNWILTTKICESSVIGRLNLNLLKDYINKIKFGKSGATFILNKNKEILVHPDNIGFLSDSKDFIEKIKNIKDEGQIYFSQNNSHYIIYYIFLKKFNWYILSITDSKNYTEYYNTINYILYITLIISLILSVIISIKISHIITKPLNNIIYTIKNSIKNNFKLRINKENIYKDEIGSLSLLFNDFIDDLESEKNKREKVEKNLKAKNIELASFNRTVSHDLKNPLSIIKGYSDLILKGYYREINPEIEEYILNIYNTCINMENTIRSLLNFALSKNTNLNISDFNLSNLIKEICNIYRNIYPKKNITLNIQNNITIKADKNLIKIALDNIISNAFKYSSKKDHIYIEFSSVKKNNITYFFIKDKGSGFKVEDDKELFTPFQRFHADTEFSGTGIGLATVKNIFDRHNFDIFIESKENIGTKVYFTV